MSSGKGERQRERGEKVGKVKEQKRERESEDGWEIRESGGQNSESIRHLSFYQTHYIYEISMKY